MKTKTCFICRQQISNVNNLVCGHFVCCSCYVNTKCTFGGNCKCPIDNCNRKLKRRH